MDTSANRHVVVWLDHHEARVFRVEAKGFDELTVHGAYHHVKRHPDRNAAVANHPDDANRMGGLAP